MDTKPDLYFAHQVLGTLFAVTNKIQANGDKRLEDLSIRQLEAVGAIIHLPEGKATINNIARFMGTTKQSAAQIISALEKKRYLSAAPSERDKRAVNVTITPLGTRVIRACAERNNEFIAAVFGEFARPDLETLLALLKKLYRFDGVEQESLEEKINHFEAPGEHPPSPGPEG
jgi:DNA-binding MarR family transcriptional regulator